MYNPTPMCSHGTKFFRYCLSCAKEEAPQLCCRFTAEEIYLHSLKDRIAELESNSAPNLSVKAMEASA